ncbi:MAG: ChaN family lipoprotein [Planctomycetota bacterium]
MARPRFRPRSFSFPLHCAALGVCLAACAGGAQQGATGPAGRAAVPGPDVDSVLARSIRVFAADGRELDLECALDAVAGSDVVFCGETHLDDVTHATELAVYDGLLRRRGGKVVLAMEMFSTDEQEALDDYTAGRIDEATFVQRSQPWGNYATGYRALIERARREHLPVVGSNAPQMLVRKVGMGGAEAWRALSDSERALMPPELLPNSAAYWTRVEHATRGHVGGSGGSDPERLLYSGQSLWDNTMGWSCARALDRFPGHLVLHVNGGFHTAYGDGTASQLKRRKPGAAMATLQIAPVADLAAATFDAAEADADYTVLALRRAAGLDEGFHTVIAARDLRYRLHVPDSVSGPLPLLIWLPAAGLRAEDGLATWRTLVGGQAIVAVLEAPYAQIEADLGRGGRWYWPDTFDADTSALSAALVTLRRYVARYHAVDPARVVLAGEGEGATAVAAAALWGDEVAPTVLAFTPRSYRKLGERGLPDAEAGFASMRVFAAGDAADWWRGELAQHAFRKVNAEVVEPADSVALTRAALGLPAPTAAGAAATFLVRDGGSPRAQAWRDLARAACLADGRDARFVTVASDAALPDDLAEGARALAFAGEWPAALEQAATARGVAFVTPAVAVAAGLPPAPGPFGGTTVLVVPAGASAEAREAWQAAVARNPMQRYGRFFRLELAYADGSPSLGDALANMVAAHRSNALVVPAVFCADAATMLGLQQQAAAYADKVDLAWLPGLGGRLAPVVGR